MTDYLHSQHNRLGWVCSVPIYACKSEQTHKTIRNDTLSVVTNMSSPRRTPKSKSKSEARSTPSPSPSSSPGKEQRTHLKYGKRLRACIHRLCDQWSNWISVEQTSWNLWDVIEELHRFQRMWLDHVTKKQPLLTLEEPSSNQSNDGQWVAFCRQLQHSKQQLSAAMHIFREIYEDYVCRELMENARNVLAEAKTNLTVADICRVTPEEPLSISLLWDAVNDLKRWFALDFSGKMELMGKLDNLYRQLPTGSPFQDTQHLSLFYQWFDQMEALTSQVKQTWDSSECISKHTDDSAYLKTLQRAYEWKQLVQEA